MIKSFCIVKGVLYLSESRLTSLLDYLSSLFSKELLENSDQAQIFFMGYQKEEVCKGTYKVFGNTQGAELALPHLKHLKTDTTNIHFEESSRKAYNKEVNQAIYPLIREEYYEDNDIKVEPL